MQRWAGLVWGDEEPVFVMTRAFFPVRRSSTGSHPRTRRPAGRCDRPERGFTLIELLVVISIVSLLLAVTLPALQSARQLAQRVKCSARLRTLVLTVLMYASDNDERLLVKDEGMNPYQLDLGFQQEINRGHPDLRDMFQGYLSGFEKTAGPSPLMFCPAARPLYDRERGRISFESGSARWAKGHYVVGYPYWAANEDHLDAIGWDWFSETDPAHSTTANPYTPIFSDPLEKHHFSSSGRSWAMASHTRSEGTTEDTASDPVGQNNARLDGSVDFVTFAENRDWVEEHSRNRFGQLEACTYSLADPDVLFLWGGRQ